jgi:hypothetical protein
MTKTKDKKEVLSDDELLILDSLAYCKNWNTNSPNLGSIVDSLTLDSGDMNISPEQLLQLRQMVHNDPKLSNLVIKNVYVDNDNDPNNHNNNMVYFEDPVGNEQYLIFAGTGPKEWPGDFTGAEQADPTRKIYMKQWVDGLHIKNPPGVTVSGHSDGGNDAMYITVTNNQEVNRCVTFDAEGFSNEFMLAFQQQIKECQSKILAYDQAEDFVGPMMNSIAGKLIFIGGSYSGVSHSISWLFSHDANGNLLPAIGTPTIKPSSTWFLIHSLTTLEMFPQIIPRSDLQSIGTLVQDCLNGSATPAEFLNVLMAIPSIWNALQDIQNDNLADTNAAAVQSSPNGYGSATRDFTSATEEQILAQLQPFNSISSYLNYCANSLNGRYFEDLSAASRDVVGFQGELDRSYALGTAEVTSIFDAERSLDTTYGNIFQQHANDMNACFTVINNLAESIKKP